MPTVLLAPILLLFGGINCFFGYKWFRIMLALWGFVLGALPGLVVGDVLILLIGGVIGAVINTVMYYVGIFIMGMVLGFLLVTFVLTVLGMNITANFLLGIVAAFIGGYVAIKLVKPIMILTTAIGGAFGMMLGFIFLFSGNAGVAITADILGSLSAAALIAWLGIAIAGIVFQFGGISGVRAAYTKLQESLVKGLETGEKKKKLPSEGGGEATDEDELERLDIPERTGIAVVDTLLYRGQVAYESLIYPSINGEPVEVPKRTGLAFVDALIFRAQTWYDHFFHPIENGDIIAIPQKTGVEKLDILWYRIQQWRDMPSYPRTAATIIAIYMLVAALNSFAQVATTRQERTSSAAAGALAGSLFFGVLYLLMFRYVQQGKAYKWAALITGGQTALSVLIILSILPSIGLGASMALIVLALPSAAIFLLLIRDEHLKAHFGRGKYANSFWRYKEAIRLHKSPLPAPFEETDAEGEAERTPTKICSECYGKGEVKCYVCGGQERKCETCQGKGKAACPTCNGAGRISAAA